MNNTNLTKKKKKMTGLTVLAFWSISSVMSQLVKRLFPNPAINNLNAICRWSFEHWRRLFTSVVLQRSRWYDWIQDQVDNFPVLLSSRMVLSKTQCGSGQRLYCCAFEKAVFYFKFYSWIFWLGMLCDWLHQWILIPKIIFSAEIFCASQSKMIQELW